MVSLRNRHPGCACAVFLCALLPVFFSIHPLIAGMGLISGMSLLCLLEEELSLKKLCFYPAVAAVSALLNPLFNHNGKTVLFFLNRNPVTREAALYGLVMGMLIAAALAWARCFTLVMDTEKLLAVTGRLSPKAALILSMALRYIPLYRDQAIRVREAQKGLGLIREENGLDRIQGGLRVMDGLVTWGLENGITTADSMTARGYGTGRRTRYNPYAWGKKDTALTAFSLMALGVYLGAWFSGKMAYKWYPELIIPKSGWVGLLGYAAFGALCLAPSALEAGDRRRWKRLRMEIRAEEEKTEKAEERA